MPPSRGIRTAARWAKKNGFSEPRLIGRSYILRSPDAEVEYQLMDGEFHVRFFTKNTLIGVRTDLLRAVLELEAQLNEEKTDE